VSSRDRPDPHESDEELEDDGPRTMLQRTQPTAGPERVSSDKVPAPRRASKVLPASALAGAEETLSDRTAPRAPAPSASNARPSRLSIPTAESPSEPAPGKRPSRVSNPVVEAVPAVPPRRPSRVSNPAIESAAPPPAEPAVRRPSRVSNPVSEAAAPPAEPAARRPSRVSNPAVQAAESADASPRRPSRLAAPAAEPKGPEGRKPSRVAVPVAEESDSRRPSRTSMPTASEAENQPRRASRLSVPVAEEDSTRKSSGDRKQSRADVVLGARVDGPSLRAGQAEAPRQSKMVPAATPRRRSREVPTKPLDDAPDPNEPATLAPRMVSPFAAASPASASKLGDDSEPLRPGRKPAAPADDVEDVEDEDADERSEKSAQAGVYSRPLAKERKPKTFVGSIVELSRGNVKEIDPGMKVRLAIAGSILGTLIVGALVLAITSSSAEKPSAEELRLLYPYGFQGARGEKGERAPGAADVHYEFKGMVSCTRHGIANCMLYEYSSGLFVGQMVVQKGTSGWQRVADPVMPFRPRHN